MFSFCKPKRKDAVGGTPVAFVPNEPTMNVKELLRIVGHFETGGQGWGAVAGNFDGAGISHGMLQWNIKFNSAQPLVRQWIAIQDAKPGISMIYPIYNVMPGYGTRYLEMILEINLKKATAMAASLAPKYTVPQPLRRELNALWSHPDMIEIQVEAATDLAERAHREAARHFEVVDFTTHLTYFDLYVNNGGPKKIIPRADVTSIETIAKWLENVGGNLQAQSKKNADHLRANASKLNGNQRVLLDLCYRRHQSSARAWKGLTMSRKVVCILGSGYINGGFYRWDGEQD